LVHKHLKSKVWKHNAVAAMILTLVAGGILKAIEWTKPMGKPFSVTLIQGNIPQDIKWSPEIAQTTIAQYLNMAKSSKAQLIVLPETAMPVIASDLDPSVTDALISHGKENKGNILVGMVEYNEKTKEYFNSAFSFGTAHISNV
jgi:apolipoprotein N-acyltransferase